MATGSIVVNGALSHSSSDCSPVVSTRRRPVLGPLLFPESQATDMSCFYEEEKDLPIPCLLCDKDFDAVSTDDEVREEDSPRQKFLCHLLTEHKIVIHGISDITSFKCYAKYWRERLHTVTPDQLSEIFPMIRTNPETKNDLPEEYFLISDSVAEDKELREFLRIKKIEALLELQHFERTDNSFKRNCLFCHESFTGNRSVLLEHLLESHHFRIGKPDNIVMIDRFLDSLQNQLEKLQCLYCERTFRDYVTLRDHMRKKYHKKINPKNKAYDKFYMINYLLLIHTSNRDQFQLEQGKSWEDILKEPDQSRDNNEEEQEEEEDTENWSEWTELSSTSITCLFCSQTHPTFDDINNHMTERHCFNFEKLTSEMDYYSRVKLINYIRRQVYSGVCIHCSRGCEDVLSHMKESGHFLLPNDKRIWDQSQYFFPTYENDQLLYVIEDET